MNFRVATPLLFLLFAQNNYYFLTISLTFFKKALKFAIISITVIHIIRTVFPPFSESTKLTNSNSPKKKFPSHVLFVGGVKICFCH